MKRTAEEYPLDKLIYMEMEQFCFCSKINVILILEPISLHEYANAQWLAKVPYVALKSEIRMELAESFYIKSYIEVY